MRGAARRVLAPWAGGSSAYQNAFQVENPAPRKGRLTARPSGKFWMPIPIARFLPNKRARVGTRSHLGWKGRAGNWEEKGVVKDVPLMQAQLALVNI